MDYHYLFRLITVGNCGVGKSCLIRRLELDEFKEDIGPSLGIELIRKDLVIENERVMVQVWDTSGNEQMSSLTANYFKSACGVLLVYDITSRKSFEDLNRWMTLINDNSGEEIQKMLIGNKADLEGKRAVSKNEGESYARAHGMEFIETSAKTAVNVVDAFKRLSVNVHHLVRTKSDEQVAEMKGVKVGKLKRVDSTLNEIHQMLDGRDAVDGKGAKTGSNCCT